MNEQGKLVTRREIYELVWQRPISELATLWGGTATGVMEVCGKMNIPVPGPEHWELVQKGQHVERTPLPPPERDTPIGAEIREPAKAEEPKAAQAVQEPPKPRRKVDIPKDFKNAHRFVNQMRKALTTDTYMRNGLVETRSRLSQPLTVLVSPAQLDRALLICDAIMKGISDMGGRFKTGPGTGVQLFIGKQSVTFRVREATKRVFLDMDMTDEEKKKEGHVPGDKYGWKGSGVLRFSICMDGPYERTWQDSNRVSLEDQVGEIIDVLANAEEEAKRARSAQEQKEKEWAEERARSDAELRRRQTAKEEQEREVKMEEESRARLVQKARDWRDARILRRFIGACQREIETEPELQDDKRWEKHWLAWAAQHADRLDPATSGFLKLEKQRFRDA